MDLRTGRVITRRKVTEIPITEHVIKIVEEMAEKQGIKSLEITGRNKQPIHPADWIAGVDYTAENNMNLVTMMMQMMNSVKMNVMITRRMPSWMMKKPMTELISLKLMSYWQSQELIQLQTKRPIQPTMINQSKQMLLKLLLCQECQKSLLFPMKDLNKLRILLGGQPM
jgi:hypothetical protein